MRDQHFACTLQTTYSCKLFNLFKYLLKDNILNEHLRTKTQIFLLKISSLCGLGTPQPVIFIHEIMDRFEKMEQLDTR